MTAPAYSVIGPHRNGVWLVELPSGAAAVMDRSHLPRYRTGTKYYWLGATPEDAFNNIATAISHLGLNVGTFPDKTGLEPAFHGHPVGISGEWGAPGAGGPAPFQRPTVPSTPTVPGATYSQGPLGGITDAISSVTDFLKWITWIFHPLNLLRAVEFLVGIGTMFYGLHILVGNMRRGSATHRTTLRSVFGWTPVGKELKMAGARRRGKRAGEIQAERDVAYRGARQKRARETGAGRRTTPGSTGGTGGTGQGSSAYE